ncbi:hypothetical protein COOONC_28216 [Cooperia oncophora]
MRGGKGQMPHPSSSDVPLFQASHVSHHSTASHSTSSHHGMDSVGEPAINVFGNPCQQAWVQNPRSNSMQTGFVNVEGYNAPSYHNVAANGQVPGGVVVNGDGTVLKQPPSPEPGIY